jgi:ubiquinone/menaquinone biosynthesis C-methylase UbiE
MSTRSGWDRFYRWKYALYAPIYDWGTAFPRERRRSMELAAMRPGERLLVIGGGSGRDLGYVPPGVSVVFTDFSPAMLGRAKAAHRARPDILFSVTDGRSLPLASASVDAAMLHMVLEVLPESERCLAEAWRVLRPGGRLLIFDKFLREDRPLSRPAAVLRRLVDPVFTMTTLRFSELLERSGTGFTCECDESTRPPLRLIRLRKPACQR